MVFLILLMARMQVGSMFLADACVHGRPLRSTYLVALTRTRTDSVRETTPGSERLKQGSSCMQRHDMSYTVTLIAFTGVAMLPRSAAVPHPFCHGQRHCHVLHQLHAELPGWSLSCISRRRAAVVVTCVMVRAPLHTRQCSWYGRAHVADSTTAPRCAP